MGVRGGVRLVLIAGWLLACLPCWVVARLFGRADRWVRRFLAGVTRILGLAVTVEGRPAPGPVLLAANHLSWLDILALGGTVNPRFIAKAEIARWPLVGRLATMGGSVFVSRERRSATRVQADAVARALAAPRPVALFAEGGTGDGTILSPFRPALFAAAAEAGAPVQPVAIDYGARQAEVAWPDGVSFAAELTRILSRPGRLPVTLRFAPPLPADDRKAVAQAAFRAVAERLRLA
jgi:1-acyl-sn-glycerol-3-phosphate acyltransferase